MDIWSLEFTESCFVDYSHFNFSEDKQSITFNDVTQQQSGSYYCVAAEFMEYLFELSEPVQV